jgi:hypothetical protein
MPLAELHGKVPSEISLREDTLTSGAFGILTTLPASYLAEWFGWARRADREALVVPTPVLVDATFWPQLVESNGGICEPDALLTFEDQSGRKLGVLVEVKYKSGMSGWPTPVTDVDVRGQLGREWLALRQNGHVFPRQPVDETALVYVTTDATFPGETFNSVAAELHEKQGEGDQFRAGAYWVSWFTLSNLVRGALDGQPLSHTERVGLARLHDLLAARRLCAFSGLARPTMTTPVPWRYATGPEAGR